MIRAISNNIPFTSKYSIDLNQDLESKDACTERDFALAEFASQANNLLDQFPKVEKFFMEERKKDSKEPYIIEFDFPDDVDADFEETMNELGVKFNKIV